MGENAAIARSLYENWNRRGLDENATLIADDCEIVHVGSGFRARGPAGQRGVEEMWIEAFPDGKVTVDRVVDGGDMVCVELTGTGTQTGPLRGPAGEIPPTGRSVTLELCDVYEFRAGKVTSLRTYFDSSSLLTQLGVLPEAGARAAT